MYSGLSVAHINLIHVTKAVCIYQNFAIDWSTDMTLGTEDGEHSGNRWLDSSVRLHWAVFTVKLTAHRL